MIAKTEQDILSIVDYLIDKCNLTFTVSNIQHVLSQPKFVNNFKFDETGAKPISKNILRQMIDCIKRNHEDDILVKLMRTDLCDLSITKDNKFIWTPKR